MPRPVTPEFVRRLTAIEPPAASFDAALSSGN
jgi:hypothetical protein